MEHDIGSLMKTVSGVNDYIWLGDFERAKKLIKSYLESLGKESKISDLEDIANSTREKILEIRRTARENKVENKRAWVFDELVKELVKEETDPLPNLCGVLAIQLSGLEKLVDAASKTSQQKTLKNFQEGRPKDSIDQRIIWKGDRYGYSLDYHIDRWEARAIMNRIIESPDISRARSAFEADNFRIDEAPKEQAANILEFYSMGMYAQLIGLERYVQISIRMPRTESDKTRVKKIVESMLDSLIG
jgi:hypothetical protein